MDMRVAIVAFVALGFLGFTWAQANDSAVETSVGGLKLRKERRVSMQKESLYISPSLVAVEYEFLNTTDTPVVSEVAFPIPAYLYVFADPAGDRDFANFKAWVDGKPIKVEKEVRAFVRGREVTANLHRARITIERFGNFDPSDVNNEIFNLKPEARRKLVKVGALKAPNKKDNALDFWPEWKAHIKYHWNQVFPPGTVVRIKHEYKPVAGFRPVQVQEFRRQFKDACINGETFGELERRVADRMRHEPLNNNYFGVTWVSYILTTANSWQTPIKDFELVVKGEKHDLITFCWDGEIERLDQARLKVLKTDFVSKKELRVYFLRNF